jgi:hypothetical protein
MTRSKSFILCFIFITVFSLSTVFGVPVDEAHPKQRLDNTPAISQPYLAQFIEQDLAFAATNFKYYYFVSNITFAASIQHFQRKVLVSLEKQLQLVLSVVAISTIYFLYLYQKKTSRQLSKSSFT